MRQIALDTETTGISPKAGHRIIEIGCVELIDRRVTGNNLQLYINPEREIDAGAQKVHGISQEFLADKPLFADIYQTFVDFIQGAELVIHNAAFDVGFIEHEFRLLKRGPANIKHYCSVVDTLAMARELHPGQRNNLDALCKRYAIDNTNRDLHGALLDSELLAGVYLAMTGGQDSLFAAPVVDKTDSGTKPHAQIQSSGLVVVSASQEELEAHQTMLKLIDSKSEGQCLWRQKG